MAVSSAELADLNDVLRRENASLAHGKLQLLLESTGEGIYGVDLAGRCTFVNRAAARLLGYTRDELLGGHMHELIHHHHSDGSAYPVADCPAYQSHRSGEPCRIGRRGAVPQGRHELPGRVHGVPDHRCRGRRPERPGWGRSSRSPTSPPARPPSGRRRPPRQKSRRPGPSWTGRTAGCGSRPRPWPRATCGCGRSWTTARPSSSPRTAAAGSCSSTASTPPGSAGPRPTCWGSHPAISTRRPSPTGWSSTTNRSGGRARPTRSRSGC